MSKNEIITSLFHSKEFKDTISKMEPKHLQEDLRSEVMLVLCEKSDEEIESIYRSGGLIYYTARVIMNMIQSNTSPFYKKFRSAKNLFIEDMSKHFEDISEIESGSTIDIFYGDESPLTADMLTKSNALDQIEALYWYDRELVKLYLKLGNYRAVEQETGIPWESVYKTIQKACKKIRRMVA